MGTANTIDLLIDEKAHSYAKIYASLLNDEFQRKRAYASIAALYAFINILEKTTCDVQKSMTLFRNPLLNEQYEIADLYVNKWHLDVRVVTGGDAVLVPKIHYDSDIVPDFYVVIKVNTDLNNAELIGFVDTTACNKEPFDYNYFCIPFTSLINYNEFLEKVAQEKAEKFSPQEHELFAQNYLGLMDNELDLQTKNSVLKHLFNCSECRTEFCCFTGFEMVSCNAVKYPDIIEDQTLTIVGAQNVDSKKYEGKEEEIYIGNDDENQETNDSTSEETVSDILDELFNVDEDLVPIEDTEEKSIETDLNIVEENDNDELEIIEEEKVSDLPAAEDDIDMIFDTDFDDTNSDLEVIDTNTIEDINENTDMEVLEDNIQNNNEENESDFVMLDDSSSDIDFITDDEEETSEIRTIDETTEVQNDYTQKVIVDYDETGEPIYSYITNVSQEDTNNDEIENNITDVEDSEFEQYPEQDIKEENSDNILDEEFEIYPEDNNQYGIQNENDITDNSVLSDNTERIQYVEPDEVQNIEQESDSTSESNINMQYEDDIEEVQDNQNKEFEEYTESDDEYTDEDENTDDDISEYDESNEYTEEDDDNDELDFEENVSKPSSKAPLILLSLLIIIGLIGGGIFFFMNNNKNNTTIANNSNENNTIEIQDQQPQNDMFDESFDNTNNQNTQEDNNTQGNNNPMPEQGTIPVPQLTESDLLPPQNNNTDMGSAIANAFSPSASSVSFRGLNWFCTSELFSDKTFKNYLQNLDNTLKQNLKNNILNATETPTQNTVAAKFAINNNGELKKVIISESSGSEQIDNIVLQSINESFAGEKSQILNDSTLKSDMYYLKVTIKL